MTTATLHATPAHQPQGIYSPAQVAPPSSSPELPIPRGPVTSSLNFYAQPEDGSKPFNYVEAPPEGQPQRNFGETVFDVTIQDLRGKENQFTLDQNAFEVLTDDSRMTYADYDSDEKIKGVYYPEVEKLILENVPGANRIHLFDHTIRRAHPNAHRAPVTRVHIDQTGSSAATRVSLHEPEDAEELLKGRYRIINVWRPLPGTLVRSFPLAVADSATVKDEELVPVQHRYPNRTGETAGVKHSADQKWYYLSGMKDNERLLLKCYDSDAEHGPRGRVPHTAFVDPRADGPEWPARESIEVRALVFG